MTTRFTRVIASQEGWVSASAELNSDFEFTTLRVYTSILAKPSQSWMRPVQAYLAGKCSHSNGPRYVRDEGMLGGGGNAETVLVWETCPLTVQHNNCIADRTPLIGFQRIPIGEPV